MDQRDVMGLSGSPSYYMQSGISGSGTGLQSGLHGYSTIHSLSNPTSMPFQLNTVGSNTGSALAIEPSTTVSPHGVNVGAPSAVPPGEETAKRKRGRPRKYRPDGTVSLALSPSSSTHPGTITSTQKRGRGRPPGTGRKQQLASLGEWLSSSAGMGFTPHILTVAVGEDIATKIMSFSQQGPRAVCVLSANGAVSTVTLCQASTFGGTVTYDGRFEILCLSGSYLVSNIGGSRNRTGGLSVSLASPDGHVIGGGVGGMLIAATPIQVIVGSFIWSGSKTDGGKDAAEHEKDDNAVSPSEALPGQSLNPTFSVGVRPGSRPIDMHNAHVDIDLMRG